MRLAVELRSMAGIHVGTDLDFIGLISRHVSTMRMLQITDGSYLAITGLIANQPLQGTGTQNGRLRALPSSACNRGNAQSLGLTRALKGTVSAPVRRHSHGRALRKCAEDHEVRGGRAPDAGHSFGPHTKRHFRRCRFTRRFHDDSLP